MSVAPLPAGWTEHKAPTGQYYYYNAATQASTYDRPSVTPQPKKKEKPKFKEPIPGTVWLKVTTTEDNVFYTNTETKTSSWVVPEEIQLEVEQWEKSEQERARLEKQESGKLAQEEAQQMLEQMQKENGQVDKETDNNSESSKKRSANESIGTEPTVASTETAPKPKRKRTQKVGSLEDLDAESRRKIAEGMSELDTVAEVGSDAEQQPDKKEESSKVNAPAAPSFTSEEAKALYRVMLNETDIEPMSPWETELPKFVSDPRYLGVRVMKERRDLFDEFCKLKIRERRAAKASSVKLDPTQAFRNLLIANVTSTRTHFSDFQHSHKKNVAFKNFGRTDREREKMFKSYLVELGERKRSEVEKSEVKFNEMLNECVGREGVVDGKKQWLQVRDVMKSDPRFIGVTSSTRRSELYEAWAKRVTNMFELSTSQIKNGKSEEMEKKEKQEASLKAREEKVRKERQGVERAKERSLAKLDRGEAERDFQVLLVDAVTEHDVKWEDVARSLSRDPRFHLNELSSATRQTLFTNYIDHLYAKRLNAAESIFLQHAPKLGTTWCEVSSSIVTCNAVTKLISKEHPDFFQKVESLFEAWQRRRKNEGRKEFDEMLSESSFVEFWGRMKKASTAETNSLRGQEQKEVDVIEEGQESEEGGVVDLKQMAKGVDLSEVESVLKRDKRWLVWDHVPDQRETWMREYLENLAAPSLTIYQKPM